MATLDDNWQTKRSTISERTKFIFNNELLSDVKFGEMAETSGTIQLPDCDYESLLELFRFLYSDKVNLSGSNVMHLHSLISALNIFRNI